MSTQHPLALNQSWQNAWSDAQDRISRIRADVAATPSPHPRITRVGKVDAELLDAELVQLLKEPLTKALSLVNVRISLSLSRCDDAVPTRHLPTVGLEGAVRARARAAHPARAVQVLRLGPRVELWREVARPEVRSPTRVSLSYRCALTLLRVAVFLNWRWQLPACLGRRWRCISSRRYSCHTFTTASAHTPYPTRGRTHLRQTDGGSHGSF